MNKKMLWAVAGIVLIALIGLTLLSTKNTEIKQFSSQSELKSFLEKNIDKNYGEAGLANYFAGSNRKSATASESSAPSADSGTRYSTTNVQVQGVDEPDFVKNDGTHVFIGSGETVTIVNAYPAESAAIETTIKINGTITNMLLKDTQLIVFGIEPAQHYPCYDCERSADSRSLDLEDEPAAPKEPYYPSVPQEYRTPRAFVKIYDLSNIDNIILEKELFYEGNYLDARMIGDYVYLIANQPLITSGETIVMPKIAYESKETEILAEEISFFPVQDYNYQLTTIFALELDNLDKKPVYSSFLTGYTQTLFVSTDNIYLTAPKYVPYESRQERMLKDVIIPGLSGDAKEKAEKLLNEDISPYEEENIIQTILADYYNELSESEKISFQKELTVRMNSFEESWQKEMQKTLIHKIHIDADDISYIGKGEVSGSPLNQFSMDEYKGYLRIATTTNGWFGGGIGILSQFESDLATGNSDAGSSETLNADETGRNGRIIPRPLPPERIQFPEPRQFATTNNVYVLDEELNLVGALENLANNERIFSARFIGDRAYLVTFKQIDPLFVIDLSEPSSPKVLGELKIPGYSTYLHPFDENTIIGIGQDSAGEIDEGGFMAAIPAGLKIGLFDVSDPSNPREIDHFIVGDRGSSSDALYDHKAFTFDAENGRLILPVSVQERALSKAQGYPEEQFWYPTTTTFQGAYVLKLSRENGIELQGRVTHLTASEQSEMEKAKTSIAHYYPPYEASIQRSLYIGNTLYTVSQRTLQSNDLTSLNIISSIELPRTIESYGWTVSVASGAGQSTPGI
ncbi:MAG: beta-propeller domain-containing protein [Nanoarchaeota archaeon]